VTGSGPGLVPGENKTPAEGDITPAADLEKTMTQAPNSPEETLPESMSLRVTGIVPISGWRITEADENAWVGTLYVEHKSLTRRTLLLFDMDRHDSILELCSKIGDIGWAEIVGELVDTNVIYAREIKPWDHDPSSVDEPLVANMAQELGHIVATPATREITVRLVWPLGGLPAEIPERIELDELESAALVPLVRMVLGHRTG